MTNDIAFKVIIKNDGISDIIFKTLMLKGEAGGTISSIEKTSSVGDVDTYTITLNDGTTTTFEVTNGSNIESIEKTATAGLIDTYTVTLTNGDTSTFEVKNGEDAQLYELPADAVVGYDKEPELKHAETWENYFYIQDNVYGIKSIKCGGITLQDRLTGKNLFDGTISNFSGMTENNGIITNTNTDTRDNLWLQVAFKNGSSIVGSAISSINTLGRKSLTITTSDLGDNIVISHNGSQRNLSFTIPFNFQLGDTFTVSVNVEGYDVQTVGGLILSKIQIEEGSTTTGYEPYCGGKPSPNPDYPQDIYGFGEKQQDGTYTVNFEVIDADDNSYYLTASGLSYPIYNGDQIDFLAGKILRYNGCLKLAISDMNNSEDYAGWKNCGVKALMGGGINRAYEYPEIILNVGSQMAIKTINNDDVIFLAKSIYGLTQTQWKTNYPDLEAVIVVPLATPTEEDVTITGDVNIIKNMKDWIVEFRRVSHYGSGIKVDYYADTDFPDGYEEIDFPLDELFYYQDQEYIEFPQSWGFAMGYVFDANEIRFTVNVTKSLKEGMSIVANKSVDLALNTYTGSGGGNLTGFNFVEASFIKEYGQIQIRLKTENAHGLTVGSLLGGRVSQGRLRITFEEEA